MSLIYVMFLEKCPVFYVELFSNWVQSLEFSGHIAITYFSFSFRNWWRLTYLRFWLAMLGTIFLLVIGGSCRGVGYAELLNNITNFLVWKGITFIIYLPIKKVEFLCWNAYREWRYSLCLYSEIISLLIHCAFRTYSMIFFTF